MTRRTTPRAPGSPDIESILLSAVSMPEQLMLLEEFATYFGYLELSTEITLALQKAKIEADQLVEGQLFRFGSSNSLLQLGLPLYINGHYRLASMISDAVVDSEALDDHALVMAYLLDMTPAREQALLARAPGIFPVLEATLEHVNALCQIGTRGSEPANDFSGAVRQNIVAFLPRSGNAVSVPLVNLIARTPGHYPQLQRTCIECYTGPPRLEKEALGVLTALCDNPDDSILSHWRKNQAHSGLLKILAHYRPVPEGQDDSWNEAVLALAQRYVKRFIHTPLSAKLLQGTHFSLSMPVEVVTAAPASKMGLRFLLETTRIFPEHVELAPTASTAQQLLALHPFTQSYFRIEKKLLRDYVSQYVQKVMSREGISPQALLELIENDSQADFVGSVLANHPASVLTHPGVLQKRLERDLGL
jgi:hypothetical protein